MFVGLGLGITAIGTMQGQWLRPAALDQIFGTDLKFWHKPWEADGLTIVSDAVSAMADFSGNGVNFTQGVAGNRPGVLTVGQLRGVDFNNPSAPQYLENTNAILAQPFYLMGVFRPVASPSAAQNRQIISDAASVSAQWRESDLDFRAFAGGTSATQSGTLGTAHAVICCFNGASSFVEVDGVRGSLTDAGAGSMGAFNAYGTGGGFTVNDSFVGQVFEGAKVGGAQTDEKLAQAAAYLQFIAAQAN